jgi:hypothetical protein
MIKSLAAAVALTVSLAGYAVAAETAHRDHRHHSRHAQPKPSSAVPGRAFDAPDIYWSPAGGNPVHYAQTTGFYAGR